MKKYKLLFIFIFLLNNCAGINKFEKETCKQIHGLFTKATSCLELKFININPKKYKEYEKTHNLILEALADQVYENKINNVQVWEIYDDIILGFKKTKKKQDYLITVLSKYN